MTLPYDVAVIGAGVFGAWSAYQLRRSGKSVILVDAYGPANRLSSSGDASRIIRMGYGGDEIYTRSAARSLTRWQELSERLDEPLFRQTGVLWLAHEDDPYPVRTAETLQKLAIPFEKLSVDEVARRYPQFGLEGIAWAMIEPNSGVLMARRAVESVVAAAVADGVEYLQDKVEPPIAKRRLESIKGVNGLSIAADEFVFACGPWLPKIFPEVLAGRINPTRQEVFYFGTSVEQQLFGPPSLPAWIDFGEEVYGVPDVDGRGIKIAIDRHGPTFDPDEGDRVATAAGLEEVRMRLGRRLPALHDAPLILGRVCQYENTSNGDFLIDRHPEFDNVWLVGGGSGHGFKHGPAVGEYVAGRIQGTGQIEARFSLETKGREQERAVY
jgi:glycine/D-amino acid oxidase-like deaminating enzyme